MNRDQQTTEPLASASQIQTELPAHLHWPFFEPHHREITSILRQWVASEALGSSSVDVDLACRTVLRQMGQANVLCYAIAGIDYGGFADKIDTRMFCLCRETLAQWSPQADYVFGLQGLGSGALSLFGTHQQRRDHLPQVASGQSVAAFALSEPQAGTDLAGLQCTATLVGEDYVLNGEKTWIANGAIADFFVVFASTGEQSDVTALSAFIVAANNPGIAMTERLQLTARQPLARIKLTHCRVHRSQRIGEAGQGLQIASQTLASFRSGLAAAALGYARCAFAIARRYMAQRQLFGQALSAFELNRAKLAEMATAIDASALLVYRAAWLRDQAQPAEAAAAMAKLSAIDTAREVIDLAQQLMGASGLLSDAPLERLQREIRALRMMEGPPEAQLMVIADDLLGSGLV